MALEIPSLPSSDINTMVNLFLRQTVKPTPKGVWPDSSNNTVHVVEDYADTDRSPEPRTPKFGESSTPTFNESNLQFGFRFPGPVTKSSESAVVTGALPLTNVSVLVSEAETSTLANYKSRHVVMETERTVDSAPTRYVLVQESEDSSSELTPATQTISHGDKSHPMMNIPTTVLDKVGEGNKTQNVAELPQIMLPAENGKPVSFIRFLNDPIPLPEQYEHQELDLDKYRAPVQDNNENAQQGSVDPGVIADIDAIQRMEQEPAYYHAETHTRRQIEQSGRVDQRVVADVDDTQRMEEEPGYHPDTFNGRLNSFSSEQCVGTSDQSSGSEQSVCYESASDDSSSNAVSPFQHNPDVMINEVAAYQCVEETPIYTELTTRVPPRSTPSPEQQKESQPFSDTKSTQDFTSERVHQESDNYSSETDSRCSPLMKADLKNVLKKRIQSKRLQEGKGELKVSFEIRPIGEPSEEEKIKAETRKQKNRDSAVRSRMRRQKQMEMLEKEVKQLERENRNLERDISKLKAKNTDLINLQTLFCGSGGESRPEYSTTNANTQGEDETLQKAIRDLLASEGKT